MKKNIKKKVKKAVKKELVEETQSEEKVEEEYQNRFSILNEDGSIGIVDNYTERYISEGMSIHTARLETMKLNYLDFIATKLNSI